MTAPKINLTELLADREAGTGGEWVFRQMRRPATRYDGDVCHEVVAGDEEETVCNNEHFYAHEVSAPDLKRIARLPALEAAYIEAVERIAALEARLDPSELTKEDYEAIYGWGGQG